MRTVDGVAGLLLLVGLLGAPTPGRESIAARGQEGAEARLPSEQFVLSGPDGKARTYRREDLLKEPPTTVAVFFSTGQGPVQASFTGVLLWTLLERAGIDAGAAKNEVLRRTVTVTGADGYRVVLSGGELSPKFGGEQAIVAYDQDGRPLGADDGFARLIVPADKAGGRNVSTVQAVDKGTVTAHVRIDIGNGVTMTSSVTNEAVDELGLKVGDQVYAIVKASDVMVGKD